MCTGAKKNKFKVEKPLGGKSQAEIILPSSYNCPSEKIGSALCRTGGLFSMHRCPEIGEKNLMTDC